MVELVHCGPHSILEDIWFGSVTTNDDATFMVWLKEMMPDHKVVAFYYRSPAAQAIDGGYKFRINIHCGDKVQQMLFKLTWA